MIYNTYKLIIDIGNYHGNISHELCAFCTGVYGEYLNCEFFAKLYRDEETLDFERVLTQVLNSQERTSSVRTTRLPGTKKNKSVVIYFKEEPTLEQIEIIKRRCRKFVNRCVQGQWEGYYYIYNRENNIEIFKYRLIYTIEEEKVI